MPRHCPQCANPTTISQDIPVDLITPPAWWPDDVPWEARRLGTIDHIMCMRCGWDREVWG